MGYGPQVLTRGAPTARPLAWLLVIAVAAACVGPAAGAMRSGSPDYVRASLSAEGLSLDSAEGLLESAAPADGGSGAGISATESDTDKKNPMVALLMSVILPGWGELYTGNTARAKSFLTAEAAIWVGYASFKVQQDMRTEDYEEYAHIYAGIPEGSDSGYYQDVADYISSEGQDSYNESVRAEARSLYPDDLGAQQDYFDANGYFGSSSWEWESEVRFEHYRDLRHLAGVSRRNAFYMTGLAVLNRALSGIDSVWMARRHNRGLAEGSAARLQLTPEISEHAVGSRLALEFSF